MGKLMKLGIVVGMVIFLSGAVAQAQWKPVEGAIMSEWAAKVDPDNCLPEYPRPQMVRKDWVNLNGLWDYAIVENQRLEGLPAWQGKILVPFPVESALSGVKKPLKPNELLLYRRKFKAPELASGKRLFINFGAVDWSAKVYINGKNVGEHKGGYDAFSFDITDALKAGGENEIMVGVYDETGGYQPKGKQNFGSIEHPGGIFYTPCSGIWQTTWLEVVPATHIESLKIVPDVDQGTVHITVMSVAGKDDGNLQATVEVYDGQEKIGATNGWANEELVVKIPDAKLWSPYSPFLYDLRVTVSGQKMTLDTDKVTSYFGMRKIALGKDDKGILRLMLNNKFVFQAGPLDQGFWPDGIYRAPTDEALRFDIEATKKLGFNMARKHVKIEPARWYYWCDKLGLLVWQDMPAGDVGKGGNKETDGAAVSQESEKQFEAELKAMVNQHISNPSIIMWVVFNEGWGQHDTVRLVKWVKEMDPSRLVNNASGWNDRQCGDVIDMHSYPGPGCPKTEAARAAVLGEFGGLGLPVQGHTWTDKSWGYRGMADQKALTRKYVNLWRKVWALKDSDGLCAAVYTQTTDCETECNGLLTYDRKVFKVDVKEASDAAKGIFAPLPEYVPVVPTSAKAPVKWKYTIEKPADDWFKPDFNDSSWKEGEAGFGAGDVAKGEKRTEWKSPDIWIRRQFTLPDRKLNKPMFSVFHDEDVEIYINGIPAGKATGYNTEYEELEITGEGEAALKSGANTIAVHCHQTTGGQYIDVGILEQK